MSDDGVEQLSRGLGVLVLPHAADGVSQHSCVHGAFHVQGDRPQTISSVSRCRHVPRHEIGQGVVAAALLKCNRVQGAASMSMRLNASNCMPPRKWHFLQHGAIVHILLLVPGARGRACAAMI